VRYERAVSATTPLPLLRPMLATAGELPAPGQQDTWAFEMKWDGVRAVVYLDRGELRVLTRNDREVSATYPEVRPLGAELRRHRVVLDGELVAFDAAGRPSFGELQARMHVQAPGRALLDRVPVSFLAFDLLHLDGTSLLDLSYDERRSALEELDLAGPNWAVPPAFPGQGTDAIAASQHQGLEGVVAKRRKATYQPGRRSRDWIKVKHVRMQEVVVGGWSPGEGNREGRIGALLLGVPDDDGRLVYVGHVGTGFTGRVLDELAALLQPLERTTPPFANEVPRLRARGAHWVDPQLVGEVAFGEWTRDERLRQPVWRGLRPDKDVGDVRRES
jgi:bifunctional non-homologous end joining protein LigD